MTHSGFTQFADPISAYQAQIETDTLEPDPAQAEAVDALQALHEALEAYQPPSRIAAKVWKMLPLTDPPTPPKGLYFYGGVGRGKSLLMDLFYETSHVEKKRRIHFHAFMLEAHAFIHDWRQQHGENGDASDPILPLARHIRDHTTLLCLDEFEVHDVADAMILARLFPLLFKRGVVAVMTSNRAPRELYPHGLQRDRFLTFVDLLEQKINVLELDSGKDYRLQKLKAMQHTYHVGTGEKSDHFLEQAFESLSSGAKEQPHTLTVQGRAFTLPRTSHNVAYASFDELCAKALGAADYLALAEEFHTLCLKGIPTLTPEKRNEARRFVMLIDALYDHGCKLICTAEAPPEALYTSGTGAFEFERTISRLQEMQSENYLACQHRTMVEKDHDTAHTA